MGSNISVPLLPQKLPVLPCTPPPIYLLNIFSLVRLSISLSIYLSLSMVPGVVLKILDSIIGARDVSSMSFVCPSLPDSFHLIHFLSRTDISSALYLSTHIYIFLGLRSCILIPFYRPSLRKFLILCQNQCSASFFLVLRSFFQS